MIKSYKHFSNCLIRLARVPLITISSFKNSLKLTVSYPLTSFALVSFMIKKIRNIVTGSKINLETIYFDFCSDKNSKRMVLADFKKFVRKYVEKAEDFEVDSLFRHFTQDQKTFINVDDFKSAFNADVKDQIFKIGIEDIIKPLATKIKVFNVNIAQLFDNFDKNHNGRLSAEELA